VRFWQALVTAEMAAGAVWADRFHGILWAHLLADAGNVVLSLLMWRAFEWLFANPTAKEPVDGL